MMIGEGEIMIGEGGFVIGLGGIMIGVGGIMKGEDPIEHLGDAQCAKFRYGFHCDVCLRCIRNLLYSVCSLVHGTLWCRRVRLRGLRLQTGGREWVCKGELGPICDYST